MKFFLIIYFVFITFNISAQNGEVLYTIDVVEGNKLQKSKRFKRAIDEFQLMTFTLVYDTEKSYYQIDKFIPLDEKEFKLAKIIVEGHTEWYQKLLTKESVVIEEIKGKLYEVKYFRMEDWNIKEETKTIQGFTCFKAEKFFMSPLQKEIRVVAWFTPEIPASFGPIGFGGLPGLILRLEKPGFIYYTAKKIILNKAKLKVPVPPEVVKKISMKEKHKLKRIERKVTID